MASAHDKEMPANGSLNGSADGGLSPDELFGAGASGDAAGTSGFDQVRAAFRTLWRNKWLFLAAAALVAAATAVYTYSLPKVYRTSSLLLVEPDQGRQGGEQINFQMQGMPQQQGALANELLVVNQSNELARRVAQRLLEMQTLPETGEPLPILYTSSGKERSAETVAGKVSGAARAYSTGSNADAIRIGVTSTHPRMAATLANVYSEEYIEWAREQSRAEVRNSREFLQEQASDMQLKLDSLENEISAYKRKNDAAALDQEASRTVQQISTLEAQRDAAKIELQQKRASLKAKQQEIAQIKPQLAERAASNVGAELERVREQLTNKEARRQQAYENDPSLRENPDEAMRDLNREIERLRERRDSLSQRSVEEALAAGGVTQAGGEGAGRSGAAYVAQQQREAAQARIAIDGIEAKIQTLNDRIAEYRRKRERIPQQSIELAQLERSRQSTEKLYTLIIERLQETRITEQAEVGYARILNSAGVPGAPFKPDTKRNLMMGVLLGLLLGGGLVFLREQLDTRLHRPADLEHAGYDMAGVIPDLTPLIEEDFGGAAHVNSDGGREVSTDLPMLLSPMSGAAEAFRRLRNTVQFSRPDAVVQALMVTSAGPGEGKTTVALNTAIAMAQADRRTLIVDADLHRPRAHRALDRKSEPGLTDVLFERRPFETSCTDTGIDHLDLLPAGREVPKPAELMGSKKMRTFIEEVRAEYDMVVFDTPPVGTLSDAMLLSTQCEGTLLVARSEATDERAFANAAKMLDDVGATLLGAVLNGFDADSDRYGYYGYGYGYGYGGGRSAYGTRSEERSSLRPAESLQ